MGVLIIPKWLILSPGHIAILFGMISGTSKNRLNVDPRSLYLSPKYFKKYKKYGNILGKYYFSSRNLIVCKWKVYVPNFLKCWILKIWKLKMKELGIWKLEIGNLEIWKYEVDNLEIGNWKLENFKCWNSRAPHVLSNFVKTRIGKWWRLIK